MMAPTPKQLALREAAARAKAKRAEAKPPVTRTEEQKAAVRARAAQRKAAAKATDPPRGGPTAAKQPSTRNEAKFTRDAQLTRELLKGLTQGKTIVALSEQLGRPIGKLLFLKMVAETEPSQIIKGTPTAIEKAIVQARDKQGQSWGQISARTRDAHGIPIPEGRVRRIYEEATGRSTLGMTNGRGGRPIAGTKPAAKPATAAKPKPAKAAATKSATPRTRRVGVKISA
jgi:hypothetical protein